MQTSFLSRESFTLWQKRFMFFFLLVLESLEANKINEIYRSATKYRSKSKFHERKSQLAVAFLVTVPGKQILVRFWNAIKIRWKQKWCRKSFVLFLFFCLFVFFVVYSLDHCTWWHPRPKKCEASKCASCQRSESKLIGNILTNWLTDMIL